MSHISKDVFIQGIAKFIDTEIMPKMKGDFLRWLAGGYVGTRLMMDLSNMYDENVERMKAYGIMDHGGNLDLDFLDAFMRCGFKNQPVLKLEPSTFLPADSLLLMVLPAHIDFTEKDKDRLFDIFQALEAKDLERETAQA